MSFTELIQDIIDLEWKQFQEVRNEGGRADCQDEPETFAIMRGSQFATWPEEISRSYRRDLIAAQMKERNLLTEKYARMMASTAPEEYARLEPLLPAVTGEQRRLAEEIIAIHKVWMKEHAGRYPGLAGQGRPLFTEEDTPWQTSSETYLRGELLTYSEQTLGLLLDFNREAAGQGINLIIRQDEVMVRCYGYDSIEEAEASFAKTR